MATLKAKCPYCEALNERRNYSMRGFKQADILCDNCGKKFRVFPDNRVEPLE